MIGFDCIAAMKAMAEPTRLRMLRLLFASPLNVNEISKQLKVSQYNTSKHLRIMREAGLLDVEKQGRNHLYSVPAKYKMKFSANGDVLDLGCCTFKLNKL